MNILFLHQNTPGQFRHLAPHLAGRGANVVFLGQRLPGPMPPNAVQWRRYPAPPAPAPSTHAYLRRMDNAVRTGQAVARACLQLGRDGFQPDVAVVHPGWGEGMFLRDVFPRARVLSYCEMFYRAEGQDTGYIPETTLDLDGRCRLRAWNADLLAALDTMDRGLSPTAWQRDQHPDAYRNRIAVVHDGIPTDECAPNPLARFAVPGRVFAPGDEVVTYVARHLEPVRGFLTLMRALPALLRLRPHAHVVICGADGQGYGRGPGSGGTWRDVMRREAPVDPARVHFTGPLARADYLRLLQVSALHLYLSVPFVLSWSCIEALSCGCLLLGADVAPVREVVEDGVNGALVDGRDPDAVARRAADMLARRALLGGLRAQARAGAVAQFDVRRCLAAQTRLVEELA